MKWNLTRLTEACGAWGYIQAFQQEGRAAITVRLNSECIQINDLEDSVKNHWMLQQNEVPQQHSHSAFAAELIQAHLTWLQSINKPTHLWCLVRNDTDGTDRKRCVLTTSPYALTKKKKGYICFNQVFVLHDADWSIGTARERKHFPRNQKRGAAQKIKPHVVFFYM